MFLSDKVDMRKHLVATANNVDVKGCLFVFLFGQPVQDNIYRQANDSGMFAKWKVGCATHSLSSSAADSRQLILMELCVLQTLRQPHAVHPPCLCVFVC